MSDPLAEGQPGLDFMKNAKCYAIISRGAIGFRFGPYPPEEVGKIMEQSLDEGTPVFISVDCGQVPFDHQLARDMRGYPEGSPELEDGAVTDSERSE